MSGTPASFLNPTLNGSITFSAGSSINGLYKRHVGLGLVDNTSDMDKPISTAVKTALDNIVGNATVLANKPALDTLAELATSVNNLQAAGSSGVTQDYVDGSLNSIRTDASNTYLKSVDASNTYLKSVDASNTYLKSIDASNTYLKGIDASNTYANISNPNFTGTVKITNDLSVNGIVNIKNIKIWNGNSNITNNLAVGYQSLNVVNSAGNQNTAFGYQALSADTSGNNNVAVGYQTLSANTTGNCNTAIGSQVLSANTTGVNNSALGWGALFRNTTGLNNTAVGYLSLNQNVTGQDNVSVGTNSLYTNTDNFNSSFGSNALRFKTSGQSNSAFGFDALTLFPTGSNNSAFGASSLRNKKLGTLNTGVGYQSGYNDISGNNNTFLGAKTDFDTSLNIYNNSTAIGYNAKINASNQIVIGTSAETVVIPGTLSCSSIYNLSTPNTSEAPGTLLPKGYSLYVVSPTADSYVYIDASQCILGNQITICNNNDLNLLYVSGHTTNATFITISINRSSSNSYNLNTQAPGKCNIHICVNATTPIWAVI